MSNPLLSIDFNIPFDRIEASHVEPAIDDVIRESQAKLDEIAGHSEPRTWLDTCKALDEATERLDYAMSVVRHLEAVSTTPAIREAHNAVQPKASEFYSRIPLNAALWNALKVYAGTPEAAALQGTRRRFLTKTMDAFRRHGAELDDVGKARLAAIDVELSKLTTSYAEHVLDSTNAYELVIEDEKQLAGLPPTAIAAARESAERKSRTGWRFTLQQPSYVAVLTYLDDASIRRDLWHAYNTRAASGPTDNRAIIVRVLELRRQKAELLGFRDFADLVLEDRMAHSGERAVKFIEDLRARTEPRFIEENRELLEFRRSIEGSSAPELKPWDVGYYAEKQRKALYDFDEEALRPYFTLQQVVAGMFEIVGRLYGVRVVERSGIPAWDAAVRRYEILDSDGTLLGAFYTDWHPRENKRGGAWMGDFITGGPVDGGFKPHLGVICGNLTPPLADTPSLLTHREVETIFHEFGHLLHHCLSRVEVRSLAGTHVAWDFVELPSQFMENWCWEREALDIFARHYQTNETIPDDLFQKMNRARTFRAANAQMRQLGFGYLDLMLHRSYSPERDGDVLGYVRRLVQPFTPAPLPEDYAMIAAFTHLFADPVGYGAGYYSYKWAEVLDADAFTRFRSQGIFNGQVGSEFRNKILARGDGEDPAKLYRDFMGRDPDPDALLERLGLKAAA